ncbi:MAG TPA: tetratricopeptide repeat protein [Rhodanobacteraceae bacterium]|nr:tetratricopeptide repeat protein [Rhodanobacteraceae bacterium]
MSLTDLVPPRIGRARATPGIRAAACLLLLMLGACAGTPPMLSRHAERLHSTVAPPAEQDDVLLKLLAAQFALQNNDMASGARGFTEAARISTDPAIAEEATHLALAVRDWPLAQTALDRWQALAPRADGQQQARAWIAFGSGRNDEAFTELSVLAQGRDGSGWAQIVQLLFGAGNKTVATDMLDRLATPERLGSNQATWILVSQFAFKLGDKALARRLAAAAVERFHGADAYAWSARLAFDRGDKIEARSLYVRALKTDPANRRLRSGYAALLADAGDNAGAARALAAGPQDDASYAGRAAYAARADDKAALAILYRELEADASPRSDQRLYLLGQVAELLGRHDQSLSWYREVPEDSENWFDAQTRQAVVLDHQGKTPQALDFLHRLRAQVGDDSEQRSATWLLEADLLAQHQRRDEALDVYTQALQILPDDSRLLYARALLEVDLDDIAGAERDLRRVIDLKPDDAEALNALGYTLADRTGRKQEALELIEKAIQLKPDEPAIIDSLGWVQYRLGNFDAALKELRRAFARQPDPEIAAHLGEVLWVNGERVEARRVWEQGRKQDSTNKALLETIRRLTT